MTGDRRDRPGDLPEPVDDGATDHLPGLRLPVLRLPATSGDPVCLAELERAVIFAYPRTGVPGQPAGPTWDAIPGARGCTPESCGFRDLAQEFATLGAAVFGLSPQTTEFQRAFALRMHLPFPLLSDAELEATRALRLPTIFLRHRPQDRRGSRRPGHPPAPPGLLRRSRRDPQGVASGLPPGRKRRHGLALPA